MKKSIIRDDIHIEYKIIKIASIVLYTVAKRTIIPIILANTRTIFEKLDCHKE